MERTERTEQDGDEQGRDAGPVGDDAAPLEERMRHATHATSFVDEAAYEAACGRGEVRPQPRAPQPSAPLGHGRSRSRTRGVRRRVGNFTLCGRAWAVLERIPLGQRSEWVGEAILEHARTARRVERERNALLEGERQRARRKRTRREQAEFDEAYAAACQVLLTRLGDGETLAQVAERPAVSDAPPRAVRGQGAAQGTPHTDAAATPLDDAPATDAPPVPMPTPD